MTGTKYSRQRETIKEYLKSTTEHPTADMVYENVRKVFPKISLGTVYRNLNLLVEQGEAIKLDCGDASERFDGNTHNHYHFMCKECSCVSDLKIDSLSHIDTLAASGFDGRIQGHVTYFYGICGDCIKSPKNY